MQKIRHTRHDVDCASPAGTRCSVFVLETHKVSPDRPARESDERYFQRELNFLSFLIYISNNYELNMSFFADEEMNLLLIKE